MKKRNQKSEIVFYVICLIILAWVFISFIDVNLHHYIRDYVYSGWNFFEMCRRLSGR